MWAGLAPRVCRVEGPAQEPLIERDLRDMAGVSMLQHAETGLWWAVKTSRRLRTASVCLRLCVAICAIAGYIWSEETVCPYACAARWQSAGAKLGK